MEHQHGTGASEASVMDVVIVGAGESGLAAGYYARRAGLRYVILEAADAAGAAWRTRYDSLVLYTPRRFSTLPGLPLPGRPGGFPTGAEIAAYLSRYPTAQGLDVRYGQAVRRVAPAGRRGAPGYVVTTRGGSWRAPAVVVATGACHTPVRPPFAAALPADAVQLHSGDYRNPAQLPGRRVLVVGAGNSGAQIAVELLGAGKDVTISIGDRPRYVPLTVLGRSVFCWGETLGYNRIGPDHPLVRWTFGTGEVVLGYGLRDALRRGRIRAVGRTLGYDAQHGFLAADASGAAEAVGHFDAVVWCTGFRPDYRWLAVPGAVDRDGRLRQRGGVVDAPGLYAVGLPWMRSRVSELIGGVGRDAAWIIGRIDAQRRAGAPPDRPATAPAAARAAGG